MPKKLTHRTHTTRALQAAGVKVPLQIAEARAGLIPSEETENLPVVALRVTHREYDTILAALRLRQDLIDERKLDAQGLEEIASDRGPSLSPAEIDELIERVQFDESLPILVIEGGVLQDAFYPVPDGSGNPFTSADYDLFDYDIFDGGDDATIVGHWNQLSGEAKAYFKKHVPEAWEPTRKAIAREKRRQRTSAKKTK